MKYWTDKETALQAARDQQDRFCIGLLVVELPAINGSLFVIIPHRREELITEGIIHYPTPKSEPILPIRKKKKKKVIDQCPQCGTASNGLCPTCKEIKLKEYKLLAEIQDRSRK